MLPLMVVFGVPPSPIKLSIPSHPPLPFPALSTSQSDRVVIKVLYQTMVWQTYFCVFAKPNALRLMSLSKTKVKDGVLSNILIPSMLVDRGSLYAQKPTVGVR